jgi:hypothetical protein
MRGYKNIFISRRSVIKIGACAYAPYSIFYWRFLLGLRNALCAEDRGYAQAQRFCAGVTRAMRKDFALRNKNLRFCATE